MPKSPSQKVIQNLNNPAVKLVSILLALVAVIAGTHYYDQGQDFEAEASTTTGINQFYIMAYVNSTQDIKDALNQTKAGPESIKAFACGVNTTTAQPTNCILIIRK